MPKKKKIDKKKVLLLKEQGLSNKQIAKNFGVVENSIVMALRRIRKCKNCGTIIN